MELLSQISFPYYQEDDTCVTLNKLSFTDELDSKRSVIALNEKKQVDTFNTIYTNTQQIVPQLASYIENPDDEEKSQFPLLIKISPEFNKLKLHVSIKPVVGFESRSLIIVKSRGVTDVDVLKNQLYDDNTQDKPMTELSKLEYRKLPIEENNHSFQKIIINDFFDPKIVNNTKLNISLWEHDSTSNEFRHFLNFSVWIDKLAPVETPINRSLFSLATKGQPLEEKSPESKLFSLGDFRKEFKIDIEDGPEFRKTLTRLENNIPWAKKIYSNLVDEFRVLESNVRRVTTSKIKVMDTIDQIVDLESTSLLKEFGFKLDFHIVFKAMFEPFEKNLNFFFENVCDHKLLNKIYANIGFTQIDSSAVYLELQKKFEADSKEYYSWINKYLSN